MVHLDAASFSLNPEAWIFPYCFSLWLKFCERVSKHIQIWGNGKLVVVMVRRAERSGLKSDGLLASKSNVLLEVIGSPGCIHFTILSMPKHSMTETNIILFFICPVFAFRCILLQNVGRFPSCTISFCFWMQLYSRACWPVPSKGQGGGGVQFMRVWCD